MKLDAFLTIVLSTAMCGMALASPASPPLNPMQNVDAAAPSPRNLDISPRSPLLEKRLGINCRGSGSCKQGNYLSILLALAYTLKNDATFVSGEQIACSQYDRTGTGGSYCVFAQDIGSETISGETVKNKLRDLWNHGCRGCGSCPVKPGNNVKSGQVTVNYVSEDHKDDGCGGHKVCKDGHLKSHEDLLKDC